MAGLYLSYESCMVEHIIFTLLYRVPLGVANRVVWSESAINGRVANIEVNFTLTNIAKVGVFIRWQCLLNVSRVEGMANLYMIHI